MSLLIKIEGPVGFGPYRYRQTFLERLWDKSDQQIDTWREEGIIPADQPGFLEYRMRLRRARALHYHLKARYPDPVRDMLVNLGQAFNLK